MNTKTFSDRFRSARILSGLSLQDLSDKLSNKIAKQTLHRYERGEMIPDEQNLKLLSEVLSVTPDFFARETKVELSTPEFRKLTKVPAKEEYRIIEYTKDYLERYLELEEIIGIREQFVNPLLNYRQINSFPDIEEAACKVRAEWGLGWDPIFNAVELLEDKNIKVIRLEVKDGFDGMQAWVNDTIPVIAYNDSNLRKYDRVRFTVMHELCHLLLEKQMKHLSYRPKETFCHQFAASILFPKEAVIRELGKGRNKLSIQELGFLKQQYGLSIQAIIFRLKDLDIISEAYFKRFFMVINQMGWRVEEPVEYYGIEKAGRFDQLIFRAIAEQLITMDKAASLKNVPPDQFKSTNFFI